MTSNTTSPAAGKQQARKAAGAVRARLHKENARGARDALAKTGLEFLGDTGVGTVSGYMAMYSEIDPEALLRGLSANNHKICLPVVERANTPLVFRTWNPGDALIAGVWDIPVPEASAKSVVPDIMLVPLLAFDSQGYRLGYGGGFYDRTIEAIRQAGSVTTIGLAYAGQQVDEVPVDQHDQKLDWILTEKGPVQCG